MKKFNLLLLLAVWCMGTVSLHAQRYLEQVFDEVSVEENVVYGANYTILTIPVTGHSTLQPLTMDVYMPHRRYRNRTASHPLLPHWQFPAQSGKWNYLRDKKRFY